MKHIENLLDSPSQNGLEVDVHEGFIRTHDIVGSDWSESHFDIVNSGDGNIDISSCYAVQNQANCSVEPT